MGRQRAAGNEAARDHDRHQRRQLDECRCQPRWLAHRLRPARRYLHHADRRRDADADRTGAGVRGAAALVAGRPPHRLRFRSRRRRQYLDHECRRQRQAPADQGRFPPLEPAELEPRRALHRRQEAFHHRAFARHRRGLALPCLGRIGNGAGQAPQRTASEGIGRADLRPRWQAHLFHAQHHARPDLRICAGFERRAVRHRTLRSGNRRDRDDRGGQWRRGAACALSRRQAARIRPPRADQVEALRQGFGDRHRAQDLRRARSGCAGNLGGDRRLSQY